MENFSRMNNALIASIDSQAKTTVSRNGALKNTLKTLIPIQASNIVGTGPYSQRMNFDIYRRFDNLAQLFMKCEITVASTADSFSVEQPLSARLFDELSLRVKGSNNIIQLIRPEYTCMRIDELNQTQVYSRISGATNTSVSFNEVKSVAEVRTATVFVPLFFFFSESPNTFLNTRNLEELTVFARTNVNKDQMGLGLDLSSATYTLMCVYQDLPNSSLNAELKQTVKFNMPRKLISTYNIFEEEIVRIPIGATSQKLLLRCPYPGFVLHVALVNDLQQRQGIKNLSLTLNGNKFLDLDYRINFQMYALFNKGFVEAETFSYWFSIQKDRTVDSGLITCSIGDNMSPLFMNVDFDAIVGTEYNLITFWEYRTDFSVEESGRIQLGEGESRIGFPNSTGYSV